jgi:hypothetical protein
LNLGLFSARACSRYWQDAETDLSISPHFSAKTVISAMASFAHTEPAGTVDDTPQDTPTQRQVRVLVLSRQLEVRQVLVRTLDRLSADVISRSTRSQADEVPARKLISLFAMNTCSTVVTAI